MTKISRNSLAASYRSIYSKGQKIVKESVQLTPTNDVTVQIVRSLVVSVIALLVDFGMLIIFKEVLGINYLLGAAMSFCLGVVVSYSLSIRWVFANRKFTNRHAEFLVFLTISAAGLGLNLVIIAGTVQLFNVDYRVAKIVSTAVVFFWNFIARKKILY
jgi:putative flippase GtrA